MIRGNDFILNPNKLEEQFQLVEVSDWVDFTTKVKLGFYYAVCALWRSQLRFSSAAMRSRTAARI